MFQIFWITFGNLGNYDAILVNYDAILITLMQSKSFASNTVEFEWRQYMNN